MTGITEPELGAFIAVMMRAGALAATAPVIGDSGVPIRARLIFVVGISIAVSANREPVPFVELPATAVLELAVGLITGLAARFIVARVAIAGQLMGLSLGLGFASEYDVHAGESAVCCARSRPRSSASRSSPSAGSNPSCGASPLVPRVVHLASLGLQLL